MSRGARNAQRVVDAAGLDQAIETAVEEAIVGALESEATERAIARVLNGPLIEQAVSEAPQSPRGRSSDHRGARQPDRHPGLGPRARRSPRSATDRADRRSARGEGGDRHPGHRPDRRPRPPDLQGDPGARLHRRAGRRGVSCCGPNGRRRPAGPASSLGSWRSGSTQSSSISAWSRAGALVSALGDALGLWSGNIDHLAVRESGHSSGSSSASIYLFVFWSPRARRSACAFSISGSNTTGTTASASEPLSVDWSGSG